jgi:hypothetical protein
LRQALLPLSGLSSNSRLSFLCLWVAWIAGMCYHVWLCPNVLELDIEQCAVSNRRTLLFSCVFYLRVKKLFPAPR